MKRTTCSGACLTSIILGVALSGSLMAQQSKLREPVFRVAKNPARPANGKTDLDKALDFARRGLVHIRSNVRDYKCTLIKRERIKGRLMPTEQMYCKIRNRKVVNGAVVQPFSVYLYFLHPSKLKGREVMYVEGQNKGKLCAHEGGIKSRLLPTVWLKPTGPVATAGQRYPLTEVGIENLVVKLLEKGSRDRAHGECQVRFRKGAKINKRSCTVIEVKHPVRRPHFDFYIAQVFIDDELNVPVRYAAYSWPTKAGGPPVLEEEYTYVNIQVNVGLQDKDFDYRNDNYNFVRSR